MLLIKSLVKAFCGMNIWFYLKRRYTSDFYIILPHKKDSYNYYALLYLDKFIESRRANNAIIITADQGVIKSYKLFTSNNNVKALHLSTKKIEKLIKYYALYEFTTQLIIVSLTEPYNTCGENLLGINGVTKKELLCFDIYRFSEIPQVKLPQYKGSDGDIVKFLKLEENV